MKKWPGLQASLRDYISRTDVSSLLVWVLWLISYVALHRHSYTRIEKEPAHGSIARMVCNQNTRFRKFIINNVHLAISVHIGRHNKLPLTVL